MDDTMMKDGIPASNTGNKQSSIVYAVMFLSAFIPVSWMLVPRESLWNIRELDSGYHHWHRKITVWYQSHPPGHPPPGLENPADFSGKFWVHTSSVLWGFTIDHGAERVYYLFFIVFVIARVIYKRRYYRPVPRHSMIARLSAAYIIAMGLLCLSIVLVSGMGNFRF